MRLAVVLAALALSALLALVNGQGRIVRTGRSTARRMNAWSDIACPSGMVPVNCQCNDWKICNGAYLSNDKCGVRASALAILPFGNKRPKPVVTCEPAFTRVYHKESNPANLPQVTCDDGSVLTGCSVYSPRKHADARPVIAGNTCKSSKSSQQQKAYAYCRDLQYPDPRLRVKLSDIQVLVGRATAARDNAVSTVECPAGTVPVDCQCDSWENCDGAYVTADKKCRVQASERRKAVKPIVACSPEYTRVSYKNSELQDRPQVSCDAGAQLLGCSIHSRWKEAGIHPTISGNTCKSSGTNPATAAYVICRDTADSDPRLLVNLQDTQVIVGRATAARDNAATIVGCPAGTVPVDCQCDSWENCDGAYVTSDKNCRAQASANRKPVKPVVACQPEYTRVTYKSASATSVSCDQGTQLVGCSYHSNTKVSSEPPIVHGNTCSVPAHTMPSGLSVRAICKDLAEECVSDDNEVFPYGPCSVTCGEGEKSRVYYCTVANTGTKRFVHETVSCSGPPC